MGGIVVVLLVYMECCGTLEEKIKLKIYTCIGFGRRMDLVSAWGRWDAWCSVCMRLDLIEGRAWQDVAGSSI